MIQQNINNSIMITTNSTIEIDSVKIVELKGVISNGKATLTNYFVNSQLYQSNKIEVDQQIELFKDQLINIENKLKDEDMNNQIMSLFN